MLIVTITLFTIFGLGTFYFMRHPKFGKQPSGERLERIKISPNYKNGKFQNLSHTPAITEGHGYMEIIMEFLFKRNPNRKPNYPLPSVKTDLFQLSANENVIVWFGHSSYFMQIDGKKFLVDPVFSGNASPIPGSNTAFKGTDIYASEDIPEIDYLLITHDHYDHVDYQTILKLRSKVQTVICGLGVGAHFEHWGFAPEMIIEKDWNEKISMVPGFIIYTTPARHFSGRSFSGNNTLWLSYVLQTPSKKIYIGGDSGYDIHFSEIGNAHGPFDIAILDNGQYDRKWKYIHMLPQEVLQATIDLQAKRLMPVHSGKFAMANHAWDTPLKDITKLNTSLTTPLITPLIGEIVNLQNEKQVFIEWWHETIKTS